MRLLTFAGCVSSALDFSECVNKTVDVYTECLTHKTRVQIIQHQQILRVRRVYMCVCDCA